MIKHGLARARLAEIIQTAVDDGRVPSATVQRAGIDSLPVFPSVIIGQPSWATAPEITYALSQSTFPIACVVNRSGVGGDTPSIDTLEDLWPAVVELLRTTSELDQTLGGVCSQALIIRADFGAFTIQGQTYPAQLITVELYG
jgi:hypothetical protein